ncbi:DNA-formamidopyrimidine glycosylase family protein [Massilia sp. TWP1-3-3]|uniref:DNA-formamidopyrimidine glycosylase family protein n=1 Tax=Massilia sp. TWP1-3-3 TaxID=2804573 RepID=UPI003CFB51FD
MPEGPSLVILREQSADFAGKQIVRAEGNTNAIDLDSLAGQRVLALRSWGKHFLIAMPKSALRIHFMLFGSYRINERKESAPRLSLQFTDGSELNFYACSVKPVDQDLDADYDWDADIMSPTWDAAKARKKLRAQPDMLVCDALLDQDIFAGVGNIIQE